MWDLYKVANAAVTVGVVVVLARIHFNNKRVMKDVADALGEVTKK